VRKQFAQLLAQWALSSAFMAKTRLENPDSAWSRFNDNWLLKLKYDAEDRVFQNKHSLWTYKRHQGPSYSCFFVF
jgi:hypothetical protein